MANTVALGAALGLIGYDFNLLNELLTGFFSGETGAKNVKAARCWLSDRENVRRRVGKK